MEFIQELGVLLTVTILGALFILSRPDRNVNVRNKGNVVIAGDKVFAGIDEEDRSEINHSIVVEFPDAESMKNAIRSGAAEFTVFDEK